MKKGGCVIVVNVGVMMVVLLLGLGAQAAEVKVEHCDTSGLGSCVPAFSNPSLPLSVDCCGALKAQQPCLCDYLKNPALRTYLNSPQLIRLRAACSITPPSCT